MFDKIMYKILGSIDDFFDKIGNIFEKKKGKKSKK